MNKLSFFDCVEDYIQNQPLQLQIRSHNGKTKAQNKLNDLIERHSIKKLDAAWFCLLNAKDFQMEGVKLGDLGEEFHKAFNSKLTLFSQNGSSMGNQIVCLTLAHKKVLMQSNSHVSLYSGLSLANAEIVLVEPHFNTEFGIHQEITPQQVKEAIEQHPDIYAVYLTSPSYEGLVANYREIKSIIGEDRLLIIDEAHGAIHYFNSEMPEPALKGGADIAISSMHKSLGTLIGTALINVSADSKVQNKTLMDAYYVFCTTSPSLVMITSVFDAVSQLNISGDQDVQQAVQLNQTFRENISTIENVFVDKFEDQRMDPMKTIFGIYNLSGKKLFKILLDEYNIDAEKCTDISVVVNIHINTELEDIEKLTNAVKEIAFKYNKGICRQLVTREEPAYVKMTKKRNIVLPISKVLAAKKEQKLIKDCVGRISGDLKSKCPPGYPFLIFGEEILPEHVQLLGEDFLVNVVIEN